MRRRRRGWHLDGDGAHICRQDGKDEKDVLLAAVRCELDIIDVECVVLFLVSHLPLLERLIFILPTKWRQSDNNTSAAQPQLEPTLASPPNSPQSSSPAPTQHL